MLKSIKSILQKVLKGIIFLLILSFNDDSFVFMESVDENENTIENNNLNKVSWYEYIYKNKLIIIGVIVVVALVGGLFFTTEIDKILMELQSITDVHLFNFIKSCINANINLDQKDKENFIKILLKLHNEKHNGEKIKDIEKFKELIIKLIDELKKD